MQNAVWTLPVLVAALSAPSPAQVRFGLIVSGPDSAGRPELLGEFEHETQRILQIPELDIQFRDESTFDTHETFDRLVVVRLNGSCQIPPEKPILRGQALGITHVSEGRILPFVEVYCERVVQALGHRLDGRPPQVARGIIARALARVAAHEIYHVLTNRADHPRIGLAKEALNPNDLFGYEIGFSPETLAAIRSSLGGPARTSAFTAAVRMR
jgi:hypothetical protein